MKAPHDDFPRENPMEHKHDNELTWKLASKFEGADYLMILGVLRRGVVKGERLAEPGK